ncbi:hypothetical protein DFR70_12623 [Nocardia tenerifensis]|uniref:Uncharacterized protein n=2 Tax=Nocardia tenerifensis TaxID=228006 RepID=A0A318JM93_9NOCA|nr:hypothetical protein DFR70_12623 [Nocardia tenerifensis]
MSEPQAIAEELFESLRRHVLMARLAPSGGALFAITKMQQSYSVSRYRPLYFDFAHPVDGIRLTPEPGLSTIQIDNQTMPFGPGGEYHNWFNRAWIPSFYEEWNAYFKPRFAPLLGKTSPDDVKVGYFGDLRLIRNDVIHHKGKVAEGYRAKCSVLKWFDKGEEVVLGHAQYAELFEQFPWAKLGAAVPAPPAPAPVDTRLGTTPYEVLQQVRRNPGEFFGQ